MTGPEEAGDQGALRRVPVILRSWDGPNSRIGLEVDLTRMPWGPFDALGQRLDLLLPTEDVLSDPGDGPESEVERALRYVEHAADRCGDFAELGTEHRDLWLRSQRTWEWIRRYLTRLWVETEVEGRGLEAGEAVEGSGPPGGSGAPEGTPTSGGAEAPRLPGAAGTLKVAARALRAMPLSAWRESMGARDPDGPTREEAIQTLSGLAQLLEAGAGAPSSPPSASPDAAPPAPPSVPPPVEEPEPDPDHVSFEFARGYDQGYQMGRRVGLALGSRKEPRPRRQ